MRADIMLTLRVEHGTRPEYAACAVPTQLERESNPKRVQRYRTPGGSPG